MALVILDASVIIALLDPDDARHRSALAAFQEVAGEDLALPASALAETLVRPSRVGKLDEARTKIRLLDLRVVPLDEAVAVQAARLRGSHRSLRLPDAVVIATGEVLGADKVLSAERKWERVSRRVRTI